MWVPGRAKNKESFVVYTYLPYCTFKIPCDVIFKTFLVPLIIIGAHFIFRYLGEKDSMFLDVFMRYVRHNNFYK